MLVVYIFVGIGVHKELFEVGFELSAPNFAPGRFGAAAADWMGNAPCVEWKKSVRVKTLVTFHGVLSSS